MFGDISKCMCHGLPLCAAAVPGPVPEACTGPIPAAPGSALACIGIYRATPLYWHMYLVNPLHSIIQLCQQQELYPYGKTWHTT